METKPSEPKVMRGILVFPLLAAFLLPSMSIADPSTHGVGNWMCPCPGGSRPLGSAPNCQVACYGSSSSGGSSSGAGGLNPQQQMGLGILELGIKAIMEEAGNSQQEAQRRAEEEARASEQRKRIAEEQERQTEATKKRLLSELKGLDASPQLSLMGMDSSPELQLMTGDQITSTPRSIPNKVNGPVGSQSDRKVTSDVFGTLKSQPDLENRDSNVGAMGNNTNAMDQLNAISHQDQSLGKDTGTQEADSEKARLGFSTGVKYQGAMSKAAEKSPSVSDKIGPFNNEEYKHLLTENQKLDSENQALTAKLEALKKQREVASGEEKGKTEMDMVKVKDLLDKNEYQQNLNEKKMKEMVDASVKLP